MPPVTAVMRGVVGTSAVVVSGSVEWGSLPALDLGDSADSAARTGESLVSGCGSCAPSGVPPMGASSSAALLGQRWWGTSGRGFGARRRDHRARGGLDRPFQARPVLFRSRTTGSGGQGRERSGVAPGFWVRAVQILACAPVRVSAAAWGAVVSGLGDSWCWVADIWDLHGVRFGGGGPRPGVRLDTAWCRAARAHRGDPFGVTTMEPWMWRQVKRAIVPGQRSVGGLPVLLGSDSGERLREWWRRMWRAGSAEFWRGCGRHVGPV